jgi:hypothetical protein
VLNKRSNLYKYEEVKTMAMLVRLYNAAIRDGLDKNITIDDAIKFDDATLKYYDDLKQDPKANKILNTRMNELTKNDVDYIINFEDKSIISS